MLCYVVCVNLCCLSVVWRQTITTMMITLTIRTTTAIDENIMMYNEGADDTCPVGRPKRELKGLK